MWHSHFVRWIKLRSFLEKNCLSPAEVQVGMYVVLPGNAVRALGSPTVVHLSSAFLHALHEHPSILRGLCFWGIPEAAMTVELLA